MNRRSFTFLELMIVLLLLVLGFIPLISMFTSGITASSDATKSNIALKLTQQKMEQLRNTPFVNVNATSEAKGSIAGFADYSRDTTAAEVSPNLKDVTVSVSWGTGPSANSVSVRTYIANY